MAALCPTEGFARRLRAERGSFVFLATSVPNAADVNADFAVPTEEAEDSAVSGLRLGLRDPPYRVYAPCHVSTSGAGAAKTWRSVHARWASALAATPGWRPAR